MSQSLINNSVNDPAPPGPLVVNIEGVELTADDRALLADPAVGAVILFTRNYESPEQLKALTAQMRATRPNVLMTVDHEGGRVQRFRQGFTQIPPMRALGHLYQADPERACAYATELAWLMAGELIEAGVDMSFAPVVDLDYGHSEIIGSRAFSASGDATAALALAFSRGLTQAGSAATIKHFPGHGHVAADSHVELPVDERPLAELKADMAPFVALIEQGVSSVMMAHVRYMAVDEQPASMSSRWIGDILRSQLGFSGCVFCDDLSMGGAAALGDYAARTRCALQAGCDYLPVCNDREAAWVACKEIAAGVQDAGQKRREALYAAVRKDRPPVDATRREQARKIAAELRVYCNSSEKQTQKQG